MVSESATFIAIGSCAAIGFIYGIINIFCLTRVPVGQEGGYHQNSPSYLKNLIGMQTQLKISKDKRTGEKIQQEVEIGPFFNSWDEVVFALQRISQAVSNGAQAFLWQEYKILAVFILCFSIIIALLVEQELGQFWTTSAFILGAVTSIASGYIGMRVAVFSNSRTAYSAINEQKGLANAFIVAFRGGSVLGFVLTSLGVINLLVLIWVYNFLYFDEQENSRTIRQMYECIAGYGLGGSTIAMFGRVGGGIYTKAADVGADLAGKVEEGLQEDDPRNPATIADNVGDNVGDIAGMGADLFGSFAESTCAALVVGATSEELIAGESSLYYPILISAIGIPVCLLTTFFATHIMKVDTDQKIQRTLKYQLVISTVLLTPALWLLTNTVMPETFKFESGLQAQAQDAFVCVIIGLWTGLIVGFVTEYYTSHSYRPVREVAESCRTGGATDIIYGLALGYSSCIVPTIGLAATIFVSFTLCGMYGIALAALGMLSNLAIALAIDGYGPISDNAGGMVEMIHLKSEIRRKTDALDAAGNTTAAIGKGFAIGSAGLVSLALFGAFVTRCGIDTVDILKPITFSGLLVGAMLPYAFSALTMKSVGKAAYEMVEEVRRQFQQMKNNVNYQPEYERCVQISTRAALKEMIIPGMMVMLTPILTGWLLGENAVTGLLAGILISGVQMATSCANSGGAWDNAKKYVEKEGIVPKQDPAFKDIKAAAVTGDTVGDPMKDTSGPSLNILVKLSAIISLVFGGFIHDSGNLLGFQVNSQMETSKTGNFKTVVVLAGLVTLFVMKKTCLRLYLWTLLYFAVKIIQVFFYYLVLWSGLTEDELSVKVNNFAYRITTFVALTFMIGEFVYHGHEKGKMGILAVSCVTIEIFLFVFEWFWQRKGKEIPYSKQEITFLLPCDSAEGSCAICLEPMESGVLKMKCGHFYHSKCLKTWLRLNPVCPSCRDTLN